MGHGEAEVTTNSAEYQADYRVTPNRAERCFPVDALPEWVLAHPAAFARQYAFRLGRDKDTYWNLLNRAKAGGGFTARGADQIACALGMHPCQLWPQWFAESMEEAP